MSIKPTTFGFKDCTCLDNWSSSFVKRLKRRSDHHFVSNIPSVE
jgi:hypothetical protein